jgi:lysyl-tRNA synthetase class 1
MESSNGLGSSAKDIVDLVPPKIFRLALFGKDINQQINFDPEGDTIPVLYDQYDKLAAGYAANKTDDYARLFTYIHTPSVPITEDVFLPRFSQVAFIVQMPHLDLEHEAEALKGAPLTDADKAELHERAEYAKRWLAAYAPEKFVFKLQDTLPDAARALSDVQKEGMRALLAYMEADPARSGEDIQHELHAIKERLQVSAGELFKAIYLSFLGKESGPQAGWFLHALPREFVLKRLQEAAS